MNAAHDLGGMRGFGPIDRKREQFVHQWEETVFAVTLACGMLGRWNLDQSRFAREQMAPADYLASSYYEHWLHGLELLLVERGLVSANELRSGKAAGESRLPAVSVSVSAERVAEIISRGAPTVLPVEVEPRFSTGDRVRVRKVTPDMKTHTRAPRYTQGREGLIMRHYGAHIFPDQHAASGEKQPQYLYSVRFVAAALWDEEREAGEAAVYADLFEPYLEAADAAS